MDLPPSSHFIYIPLVMIIGLVLGFFVGTRVTQESHRLEAMRTEERARKKAERQAERAARAAASANDDSAPPPPGKS
jgi:uncharacterized membrane protein